MKSEDRDCAGRLHPLHPEGQAVSKEGTAKPLTVFGQRRPGGVFEDDSGAGGPGRQANCLWEPPEDSQ